jgi:hypothetical protein
MSAWRDVEAVRDGKMTAGQAVADTALNTGVGGASGLANDALARRLGGGMRGGLKGGAIVDALTSGAFSTWDNAKAVREGRESAHKLADASGFTDWSKRGLRGALNHFNRPLPRVLMDELHPSYNYS